MKQYASFYLKPILADRTYLFLLTGVVLTGLLLALFVVFTVEPSDIQVVTQYSSIGESHFYKSQWYYLYVFAGFGLIVSTLHAAIMVKLYYLERRDTGIFLGWVSILICIIAARYAYEVMALAFL